MNRCPICDWPMAESVERGCVPDNCSYRPDKGSPEYYRIQARKARTEPTEDQAALLPYVKRDMAR
jgi:hypothetical protein